MRRPRALSSAIVSAALILAACSTVTNTGVVGPQGSCAFAGGPAAFVIGGRSNTPAITGTSAPPPSLVASTQAAVAHHTSTLLVDTGGSPDVQVLDLEVTARNDAARKQEESAMVGRLQDAILATRASAEEANPLEALALAADHIRGNGGSGTIVMLDSGLQTAGVLDYTKPGMLQATSGDVAASLSSSGQLPDLSGISVLLIGIGSTAAPQESLDGAIRHNVQAQWHDLVRAAGAACVSVDTTPMTNPAAAGLPAVSTVAVPEVSALIPTPQEPTELSLPFQSNSDQFVDAAGAQQALAPLATWLKQSGTRVLLTGTTATDGTEEGRLRLSQMRADAVRAALEALGVDGSQIATEGVGTHHPSHVDDLDKNGELLPGPAARNRLVIVSIRE